MSASVQSETLLPDSNATPAPLVFTDSAAGKVKTLIDEEGNPDLKLRVFVQGGGCSGFQYGFTFDEAVNEATKMNNLLAKLDKLQALL